MPRRALTWLCCLTALVARASADPPAKAPTGPSADAAPASQPRGGGAGAERFGPSAPLRAALGAEMRRSLDKLRLPGMPEPYFVMSTLADVETLSVSASLGAVNIERQRRLRTLDIDLRVGSYELDSSGFVGDSEPGPQRVEVPIDADQGELRRAAWLALDGAFKRATADYEGKRAARHHRADSQEQELQSFTKVAPNRSIDESSFPLEPSDKYVKLARELSDVFREFAFLQSSGVAVTAESSRSILLSSEGTEIVEPNRQVTLMAWATTQAEDGMLLAHQFSALGGELSDLPPRAELEKSLRELGRTLQGIRQAPVVDNYTGPLVFEGEAAAQLALRLLPPQLSGTPAPEMPGGYTPELGAWASRVGLRVLPTGFSVVDDPGLSSLPEGRLYGGYAYDDEGVRAERVEIVSNGTLQQLLMSRTPSREFDKSNGHGRQSGAGVMGRPSNLVIRSSRGVTRQQLRQALLAEVRRQELPYGFIVKALEEPITAILAGAMGGAPALGRRYGSLVPVALVRLHRNGKEELVRGAAIDGLQVDDLTDVLGATRTLTLHHSASALWQGAWGGGWGAGTGVQPPLSFAVPDLLVRKADVRKPTGPHAKPPVMSRPSISVQ